MADKVDPTINMLRTKSPEHFKLAAHTPGRGSISSAQASAAQSETSRKLKVAKKGRTSPKDAGDASKAGVDHAEESEQTVPDRSAESGVSDAYKELCPILLDGKGPCLTLIGSTPLAASEELELGHDSETEAATPSKSKEGDTEPSLSKLIELAREHNQSPDKEKEQSLLDLLRELPASSNKSPTKRSTSPPLNHAIARRASILSYRKPSASQLRNEIQGPSANGDELAQTMGGEPHTDAISLKKLHAHQGRATDENAISRFGKSIDVTKANQPAPSAHLPAKSKTQREGATEVKTVKEGIELADDDSLEPPIFVFKDASGSMAFALSVPTLSSGSTELMLREPGVGLSADERVKVPDEFRHLHSVTLARFWDFAYNPVVRETVLDFKRNLALAGEADKELNWPNRLLVTLVGIQEAEIQKDAKHVVDASDIKTSGRKLSASTTTEEPTELSDTGILLAALVEAGKVLADPSYDTTTAREKLALSKGVKLDSILTEILMDFHKDLQRFHYSSDMNKAMSEKLASLELETFGKGKAEESALASEEAKNGKVNGKLAEGLATGNGQYKENEAGNGKGKRKGKGKKGKGKKSKSLMDNATTGDGKGEQCNKPVEALTDSTIDKGKSKDNELPQEDATNGKGKAKESEVLVEDPVISKGQGKENEPLIDYSHMTKGKVEDMDFLFAFALADTVVSKGKGTETEIKEELCKVYNNILAGAKALFLDPKSVGFLKSMGLNPNAASKSTASSACPHDANVLRDLIQFPLTRMEESTLMISKKAYDSMEKAIRPQTALPSQVELTCKLLVSPEIFTALSPLIEELRWNR